MKKLTKLFLRIGILIASINILWLVYDAYQYQNVEIWFIDLDAYKIYVHLIFYGILVSFVSHLFVGTAIIYSLKNAPNFQLIRIGILILGYISYITLIGDWAALCDILNEYPLGFEINNELPGVKTMLLIHFLFFFSSLVYLMVIEKTNHAGVSVRIQKEQLFILLNSIGIIGGFIETAFGILYFLVGRPFYKFEIILFIIVLIPFFLIFGYWIIRVNKDKSLVVQ